MIGYHNFLFVVCVDGNIWRCKQWYGVCHERQRLFLQKWARRKRRYVCVCVPAMFHSKYARVILDNSRIFIDVRHSTHLILALDQFLALACSA